MSLKTKSSENEKTIEEVTHRNEMLSEPLSQAEAKVTAMKSKLVNYEKVSVNLLKTHCQRWRVGDLYFITCAVINAHRTSLH